MSTTPMLRRFDIVTYKNKSGSDTAQVPTAATVTVYRQGATSQSTHTYLFTDTTPYTIDVDDIGDILAGETVQVGADASKFLTVDSIPSQTQLSLINDVDTVNVTISVGDRLIPITTLPTVYSDPFASASAGNPLTANSTTGRVQAYVRNKRFDYTVTGTVSPGRVFANAEGGSIPETFVNALDFPTLNDAIATLGIKGGTVYVPNGEYVLTDPIAIDTDNITLIGDGHGTVIRPDVPNTFDLITVNVSHFRMYNMLLDGGATTQDLTSSGKCCLVVNGLGVSGHLVLNCLFENVAMINAPKHGLLSRDTIIVCFINCEFVFNQGDGARLESNTTGEVAVRFFNCAFTNNGGHGLSADNVASLLLSGCNGELNSKDGTTGTGDGDGSTIAILTLGKAVVIQNCAFEAAGTPGVENLVFVSGAVSTVVSGCYFLGGDGGSSAANRGFRNAAGDVGVILEACAWTGFRGTEDASAGIPAGSVAVLRGTSCFSFGHYLSDSSTQVFVESANSIQFVNGSMLKRYASPSALPSPGVEPGTMVYVNTPTVAKAHVRMSDGSAWQTLGGGVIAIYATNGDRPAASSAEAGTLIYVTNPFPGLNNLQISDGSTWIGIA